MTQSAKTSSIVLDLDTENTALVLKKREKSPGRGPPPNRSTSLERIFPYAMAPQVGFRYRKHRKNTRIKWPKGLGQGAPIVLHPSHDQSSG